MYIRGTHDLWERTGACSYLEMKEAGSRHKWKRRLFEIRGNSVFYSKITEDLHHVRPPCAPLRRRLLPSSRDPLVVVALWRWHTVSCRTAASSMHPLLELRQTLATLLQAVWSRRIPVGSAELVHTGDTVMHLQLYTCGTQDASKEQRKAKCFRLRMATASEGREAPSDENTPSLQDVLLLLEEHVVGPHTGVNRRSDTVEGTVF